MSKSRIEPQSSPLPHPQPSPRASYSELLRHPKWQERRLRIMDAAGFKCQSCGTNEVTLNVHHLYYRRGAKPWEYPDTALVCLCEPCHKRRHEEKAEGPLERIEELENFVVEMEIRLQRMERMLVKILAEPADVQG